MVRLWLGAGVVVALVAAACGDSSDQAGPDDPGDCIVVDVASSPEKLDLFEELRTEFNESDESEVDGECVFVRVSSVASGGAEQLLRDGWGPEAEAPPPAIWSPAASTWGAVLNHHLAEAGEEPMVNLAEAQPFMLTPLVIAMTEPAAEALGWPDEPIGYSDILDLVRDEEGWGSVGHPEWGEFRLGKTNPNFSTSGLAALVAQSYAATGKAADLSVEDVDQPEVDEFARSIEKSVVHYGDTTLTFLRNWYEADQRGNATDYVSAVAVEEKSVIDYNLGNPEGVLEPGAEARPPRDRLVAIYPSEGTMYSDNPLMILDAEWVSEEQQEAASLFVDFLGRAENQEAVVDHGFRPASPDIAVGGPISEENGVNPEIPQTLLEAPEPEVLAALIANWEEQRKPSRALLVMDVSGSMGETADPETGATRLDLAKEAAIASLDHFRDEDEVGLWIFSTDLGPDGQEIFEELVEVSRVGDVRERLAAAIRELRPVGGTPLYAVTHQAYDEMVDSYDSDRINAIVLLSDGENDYEPLDEARQALDDLLSDLRTEGIDSTPVRVFPLGYSTAADMPALQQIAEASSASVYDATDPLAIQKVLQALISNF